MLESLKKISSVTKLIGTVSNILYRAWRVLNKPDVNIQLNLSKIQNNVSLIDLAYSFDNAENIIHPFVIRSLLTEICDTAPVYLSINLHGAKQANKYYTPVLKNNDYFTASEDGGTFAYRYIGCINQCIYVVQTWDNSGGTGYFYNLAFLIIEYKELLEDLVSAKKRNALILSIFGEFSLGDRFVGDVSLDGNDILISGSSHQNEKSYQNYKIRIDPLGNTTLNP